MSTLYIVSAESPFVSRRKCAIVCDCSCAFVYT